MNYALTAIKLAGGEETPRFEATVTLDGRRIAHVSNGGTGGCNDWFWHDRAAQAPFDAWIKANTTEEFEPDDGWVYDQLDKFKEQKTYMRLSLKKVLFRIEGDGEDSYRTLGTTDLTKARAWLLTKYPTQKPNVFDRDAKQFVAA